jgi:hypothetical protein
MDMTAVRTKAESKGLLKGELKKNHKGEVRCDIFVDPLNVYTFHRVLPVPVLTEDGRIKKLWADGSYVWTHINLTMHVPALTHGIAIRLVNGGQGLYEKILEREWHMFNYQSRPWMPLPQESHVHFSFQEDTDMDDMVEDYREQVDEYFNKNQGR